MLQMAINFVQQNSGDLAGAGQASANNGGKVTARQVLLRHQDAMQKLGFSMNFSEDYERDRTELRLSHILQFYSIPKIEKITGKKGKEVEQMVFREIQLSDAKLSDGRKGNRIIKLITDEHKNPDSKRKLEDELSVKETMGELNGTPTEALAVSIDTFLDFNNSVQVVKYSSYERNQAIDQASRMEFANWRINIAEQVPIKNPQGLVEYVEEAFDIDTDQFETSPGGVQEQPSKNGQSGPNNTLQSGGAGKPQVLNQNSPSAVGGQAVAGQ